MAGAALAIMLDVLIQTHNEELNLPHTLASVQGWVNRIFVVDSGSTDKTAQIAQSIGAQVVQKAWQGYARQKNWALANLPFESPWILILDADESVTPQLKDEILQIVSRPAANVAQSGFFLNRVTIFMGRQIHHCAYFPAWNMRLFKRGLARYEERDVHEHMIVDGPTGHLKHLLLHEDRRGLEHFIAKHNRYSTLEAMEVYRQRERWPGIARFFTDRTARRRYIKYRVAPKLPMPWLLRFCYMYFIRGGILDRRPGLTLCLLISTYELFIRAKYLELVRTGGKDPTGIEGLALAEGGDKQWISRASSPSPPTPERGAMETADGPQFGASASEMVFTAAPRRPSTTGKMESSPWKPMENFKRALWMIVRASLFRFSFHNWYGWRRMLLQMFGAKLGRGVRIRPTAMVEIPWNLTIGDDAIIGDYAILYSLGQISIGARTTVSQFAHLCAGTHDHTSRRFPLLKPPIVIGQDAWIAADAFISPGVTVGDRAVVGARATVVRDVPADQIVVGPAAAPIKPRIFRD